MRAINEVIVHCTATKEGKDYTVADIDSWHRAQGWNGIGYHYVIYRDGTVHTGRAESEIGAHCKGHNSRSIGVCYVGGLDSSGKPKDTRTPEQKTALLNLLTELKGRYKNAEIHGHRDFSTKACPCFNATNEYKDIK